ncbi:hypothetical protein [Gemmiger formicilis]
MMSDSGARGSMDQIKQLPVCAACWRTRPVRRWKCLSAPTIVKA